ncbi:glycosyl hydrolase family 18 protein [Niallia sp. 01092]|uniref:glycosyl hydrolase family 18 protein n=1 Tax=unclassified Niallia TaxID=2837522 RepID=UPI003FD31C1E
MAEIQFQAHKNNKKRRIIVGFCIGIFMIMSSILLLLYPFASKEKTNYFTGENPILLNGKQIGNAMVIKKNVYVPLSVWQQNIDDTITYDTNSNSVIVTTKNKVVQFPSKTVSYFVNNKAVDLQFPPIKDKNGEVYVALEPLVNFYPIQYSVLNDGQAVLLEQNGAEKTEAAVTGKKVNEKYMKLRSEASLLSPYTEEITNNETVTMEKEDGDFYYVRKKNGVAGFVKKDIIQLGKTETVQVKREERKPKLSKVDGPIQLTWEAVYTKNPDTSKLEKMEGVNVVSPTWFKLSGNNGNVSNLGSAAYVKWAHKHNYQVWGLFSNDFDPDKTHQVLKDYQKRQKVIRQLLVYSKMYHLDGINIDIENVNKEDGKYVTQFVRELTPYLHEAGLTVSMDITFIAGGNYSAFYERGHLSDIVDYLVVMAYDEHWASSPTAGSVASFPWVEANLENLLKEVPNKKLVLGVPLYARLWEEKANGEISSQSLSMEKVEEWLKKYKVTPTYDETTGQNYAEYYDKKTKSTYKIWLEDELSLSKRAKLVDKYKLAGVASWSRYFASEEAWTSLALGDAEKK